MFPQIRIADGLGTQTMDVRGCDGCDVGCFRHLHLFFWWESFSRGRKKMLDTHCFVF